MLFAHVIADARLRIVSERVDFIDNLIISVTVISHSICEKFILQSLFRLIVFIVLFVSDRPSKFHVYKIKGQEYLDSKRCCRLCFIRQICIGNSFLAFYPKIFGPSCFSSWLSLRWFEAISFLFQDKSSFFTRWNW